MAKLSYVNVDRIKELSKSHGISLKYFCDLFGKTRTYLSDVRSGKNKMDESELGQIADILETTVEYLTDETDDPSPKEMDELASVLSMLDQNQREAVLAFARGLLEC